MPVFEGQCACEVVCSAVSVVVGDGDPCSSKDARVIVILETTKAPVNCSVGVRICPLKKGVKINNLTEMHLHQCTKYGQDIGGAGIHGAAGKL